MSFDTESGTSPSQLFGDHGTHCAGIASSVGNNSIDVIGLANNCRLMSVSNSLSSTTNSRITRADGINWAWQNGADVISNSWTSGQMFPAIDDAIELALTQGRNGLGTIIVFASGNNNGSVTYPANSNPDILAVGASNQNNQRSEFSNFGNELDVVAPGSNILSTILNNDVGFKNGTSMAAPYVAGLAALILSIDPCLTVQEVNDIIESTAQKVGGVTYQNTAGRPNGVWNNQMGYGLIDAEAALQEVLNQWILQNSIVTQNLLVAAHGQIRAGENVTDPLFGQYLIASGADVEFKATESITLESGFTSSAGSNFLAHIEDFNGDCNQWNSSKKLWVEVQDEQKYENSYIKEELSNFENSKNFNPIFFPNPYNELLYIKYDLDNSETVSIHLYDLSGREVYSKVFNGHTGQNMHLIDVQTDVKMLIGKTCVNGDCKTSKLVKIGE